MVEKEQSNEWERPPIVTRYTNQESKAEVDAEIKTSRDKTLTHHSYGLSVINGWEQLTNLHGANAPETIAALGHAMHQYHVEEDEEALEEFIENYFKSGFIEENEELDGSLIDE